MTGSSDGTHVDPATTLDHRAMALFERSLDIPRERRDTWLDRQCGDDQALREEVSALQSADTEASELLDNGFSAHALRSAVGSRIGPYRLDRLIAEGGMGAVYLAHRDDGAYQQKVAVKFIRPLLLDPDAIRRFESERQILAQLQHPNIARMLDGGTTAEGTPFVVMEFVDGVAITEYCDRQQLELPQRLDLFRGVCAAVQAAHRNLIVHRDLKPGNILVTADGIPKLLDFGIAKILLADSAPHTAPATAVALTPDYASPEQIQKHKVTTSSDVYSLGVLLYELLTDHRPYALDTATPAEAERLICRDTPPLPSEALRRTSARADAARHARALRGDLDTITMMALRKEPERRYGSVQELSGDVHRYLRGLPISARRDSGLYRVAKFSARHRWSMAAAILLILSMLAGIAATGWQANRAEAQRVKAEHISDFFKTILMSPSSQWISKIRKGPNVTMAEVLDVASRRADAELGDQPDVQADVLTTITQAYVGMGLYDKAIGNGQRALGIIRAHLPPDHRLQANARYQLARAFDLKGNYAAAERLYLEAIDIGQSILPARSETLALIYNDLAMMYATQHRLSEAERQLQVALTLHRRRLHGRPGPALAIGLNNLGVIRTLRGDLAGAMQAYDASLAMFARLPQRRYAENANLLSNMSVVHVIRGEWSHARKEAHQAVIMGKNLLGEANPNYAVFLIHQANADIGAGQLRDVGPELDEARRILQRTVAPEHIYQVWLNTAYGEWYLRSRHFQQAEKGLMSARNLYKQAHSSPLPGAPPSHTLARILGLLGATLLAEGKPDQARPLLQRSVKLETELYGTEVAEVRHFRGLLARASGAIPPRPCPAATTASAACSAEH